MRWLRRHSSKTIAVKVSTLESDLEFSIPVKSTGKDLFDLVCGTFGLRETWYFGLQSYVLVNDGSVKYLNWLKPDKVSGFLYISCRYFLSIHYHYLSSFATFFMPNFTLRMWSMSLFNP